MGILKTVLLVDDKSLFREAVATVLEREGYTVTVAADGPDMLSSLSSADAIILNTAATGVDAQAFLEAQHLDNKVTGRPYIIISSASQSGAVARLHSIGVNRVIPRGNSTLGDVLQAVRAIAGKPLAA